MSGDLRVVPLACQSEAARFATTREDVEARVAVMRANGLQVAMDHLLAGHRGRAYAAVTRTFLDQARTLGLHLHQTESGQTW